MQQELYATSKKFVQNDLSPLNLILSNYEGSFNHHCVVFFRVKRSSRVQKIQFELLWTLQLQQSRVVFSNPLYFAIFLRPGPAKLSSESGSEEPTPTTDLDNYQNKNSENQFSTSSSTSTKPSASFNCYVRCRPRPESPTPSSRSPYTASTVALCHCSHAAPADSRGSIQQHTSLTQLSLRSYAAPLRQRCCKSASTLPPHRSNTAATQALTPLHAC